MSRRVPTAPTFASNTLIMLSTQVTVMAVGLFASVVISRALGAEGRGEYYVPITAVTLTFAVGHLSVEMAVRYFYAERLVELPQLARASATGALIIGTITVALLCSPYLLGIDEIGGVRTAYVALASLALPFTIHSTWLMNLFVLAGELPRSQAAALSAAVLQTAALTTLWLTGGFTVERVLVVYVAAAATSWLLLVTWSRAFAPAIPSLDRALLRRVAVHGLKIHAGFIAYFVLLRVDVFLIQGVLTLADVGLYSLAVLFAELIGQLAGAIAVAGLPFQSVEDRDEGAAATLQTVRMVLFVSVALSAASAATMWFLLPLLYGASFASAYGPMVALLPGVVAMTAVKPMWNWLVRDGRPARITALFASGLALNVLLNLMLLPAIGLYGASVASSLAYVLVAIVIGYWTLRDTGGRPTDLLPRPSDVASGAKALRGAVGRRLGRPGEPPREADGYA